MSLHLFNVNKNSKLWWQMMAKSHILPHLFQKMILSKSRLWSTVCCEGDAYHITSVALHIAE